MVVDVVVGDAVDVVIVVVSTAIRNHDIYDFFVE